MSQITEVQWKRALLVCVLAFALTQSAKGETVFIEAESMQASSNGWKATDNDQTRRASRVKTMWGAAGAGDAVATKTMKITEAGKYRLWVRYMQVSAWRGPFQVSVAAGEKLIAGCATCRLPVADHGAET